MRSRKHEFAAKKIQGKITMMQRNEQVVPPYRCIAQIKAEELYERTQCGVNGGGGYCTKLAGERTSADMFSGFAFESTGSLLQKT